MSDARKALEAAAKAVWEYEQRTGRDIYRSKEGYARAAVLAFLRAMPANEIGRLRTIVHVNALRHGANDAGISAVLGPVTPAKDS